LSRRTLKNRACVKWTDALRKLRVAEIRLDTSLLDFKTQNTTIVD
jgi:hypothetical protein